MTTTQQEEDNQLLSSSTDSSSSTTFDGCSNCEQEIASFSSSSCPGPRSYVRFNFSQLCRFTVSLPLVGLVFCFVSANIFQQNDIHETHCRVYNIIPSISSITGISPQRYIWRIIIALHVGPRFLTSLVYHRYYLTLVPRVNPQSKKNYLCYVWLALALNLIEQASLIGVTYVSNRENYPIHEKIFIVFMFSSQAHMLVVLKLLKMAQFGGPQQEPIERRSYLFKRALFLLSLLFTFGLCIFFVKHRIYCHDMAFSWFSFCEYWIAGANMGFHATIILDFPDEDIIVGSCWIKSPSCEPSQNKKPTSLSVKKDK